MYKNISGNTQFPAQKNQKSPSKITNQYRLNICTTWYSLQIMKPENLLFPSSHFWSEQLQNQPADGSNGDYKLHLQNWRAKSSQQ